MIRHLFFNVNFDENLPHLVLGDGKRLGQILFNLLSFAVISTPEGGSLGFSMQLQQQLDDICLVRFVITDSGTGLDPSEVERLWDPAANSDLEDLVVGLGSDAAPTSIRLGMPLARHLIDMMGGEINVASSAHEGTTFSCTIPMGLDGIDHGTPSRPTAVDSFADFIASLDISLSFLRDKKLLVVDDVEMNRSYLQDFFTAAGAQVDAASNGAEALGIFKQKDFDAILMDLSLPVMDGFEAAENIRLLKTGSSERVRIIALTADAGGSTVARLLQSGMDDYAAKPIDLKGLVEMLEQYLIW
jgi:CheY-like chemotaxis protein